MEIVPRCYAPPRGFAREFGQHAVGLVEHVPLLLDSHIGRVLVRVAVQTNFMARVSDSSHVLGEGLQRVARNEPGGFDFVLVEQFQQTPGSYCPCPNP